MTTGDLRHALRSLRRNPSFTLAALLTLTLGIGANTAVFSVVHAVILRPLPYRDPGRLAVLWASIPAKGIDTDWSSYPALLDWKQRSQTFIDIGTILRIDTATLTGAAPPERIKVGRVSANLFSVLGVSPVLGRTYTGEEEQRREPLVVLSHAFWESRFGSAPGVVGERLEVDRKMATVIGVMPAGFHFPDADTQLWLPLSFVSQWPAFLTARQADAFYAVGRLKPGVTVEQAQAEMHAIAGRLARQYPDTDAGKDIRVVPLSYQVAGRRLRLALWLLMGSIGLVLLMACSNVAGLLLARGAARQKEIALRICLGASRMQVVRQLLTESLALAGASGLLGLGVAALLLRALTVLAPPDLRRLDQVSLAPEVLAFTLGVSMLSAVLFGTLPALQDSQVDPSAALKEGQAGGRRRARLRGLLVSTEFALAIMLLAGAALLTRSLLRLQEVDLGFRPDHLLFMEIDLPGWYSGAYPQPVAFFDQAIERVRALPGIVATGAASGMFAAHVPNTQVIVEGRAASSSEPATHAVVAGSYFQALGIPLLRGRQFSAHDGPNSPYVAVINQTMAARFWPGENPLGKRFSYGVPGEHNPHFYAVVGVVGDTRPNGLESQTISLFYLPHRQAAWLGAMDLVARTTLEPRQLAEPVRHQIHSVDKNVPRFEITTVEHQLRQLGSQRQFQTWLLGLFSGMAVLLAAVGISGLLHYSVSQRTREIGIRMALGARVSEVLTMILRQGLAVALAGIIVGLAGAFCAARMLSGLLYGIGPADPMTFAAISVFLAAVALAACWVPARRAARIDPMTALRHE